MLRQAAIKCAHPHRSHDGSRSRCSSPHLRSPRNHQNPGTDFTTTTSNVYSCAHTRAMSTIWLNENLSSKYGFQADHPNIVHKNDKITDAVSFCINIFIEPTGEERAGEHPHRRRPRIVPDARGGAAGSGRCDRHRGSEGQGQQVSE